MVSSANPSVFELLTHIPMRSLSRWTSFFWIQLRKTSAAAFPFVRMSSINLAVCCWADVWARRPLYSSAPAGKEGHTWNTLNSWNKRCNKILHCCTSSYVVPLFKTENRGYPEIPPSDLAVFAPDTKHSRFVHRHQVQVFRLHVFKITNGSMIRVLLTKLCFRFSFVI